MYNRSRHVCLTGKVLMTNLELYVEGEGGERLLGQPKVQPMLRSRVGRVEEGDQRQHRHNPDRRRCGHHTDVCRTN